MLKKLTVLCCIMLTIGMCATEEKDSSLLFKADFDNYSVNANYAKGDPKCYSFENPDLQLRMFPGINGKGNAVSLSNNENCTYKLPGNFDPRQGTVSLWISPQNWKVSGDKWQKFFSVSNRKFQFILYKYMQPNHLLFYIKYPDAPSKKKIFLARAMLKDVDWTAGKWHKLDVTWDSKGMKLYIDGIMPEVYHKKGQLRIPFIEFQNPIIFPADEELEKSYVIFGMDNAGQKHHATDQNHMTAYDDIKIYNRPLSAAEIREGYEKYFPSEIQNEIEKPIITVPKTNSTIKIDGKIMESEWNDAGLVPVIGFLGEPLPGIGAKAYYKYDDKYLYIGMTANRACRMLKNYTENDAKLWQEDSFEIVLQSPKKDIYHLIINGNGAVFDELNTNKKWNSSAHCIAFQGKDFWSAEIAIPLESLGGSLVGQTWQGNFGATYYTNTGRYSGWSNILSSYANPKSFGVIKFGRDNRAVRLENLGDLSGGALELVADVVPVSERSSIAVSAKSELDDAETMSFPGQLAGKTWDTTLPAGKQKLQIKASADKKEELVFLYEKYFQVNFPLEVSYTCWQKRKYIEVRVDLNNSGIENLNALSKEGLNGTVELIDSKGKTHSSEIFTAKKPNYDVRLKLPDGLILGKYSIKVGIVGVKGKLIRMIDFKVPDMTPYTAKVADDHSIPYPWQPVTTLDGKTFKLLDREYTFDGGAFPVQAISRGEKLLNAPVSLLCNGNQIEWSDFKIVEQHEDVIKLDGRGIAGKILFDWNGELWFDGLYSLKLKMSPESEIGSKIDSLNISWRMPEEFAKFVMSPLHNKWHKDQISFMPGPSNVTTREHIVWLTGHLRGFLWWPESDANWVNDKDEKPIVISRKDGSVNVSLNIISKTAKLTKDAVYRMAFMATPAKDQPKDFRKFHVGGHGIPKVQTAHVIGWGSFRNEFRDNDTTTPASHIPRNPVLYEKFVQHSRNRSIAPFTYAMPGQISSNTAEYDYFSRTWATTPSHQHRLTKGGEKYMLQRCCGNTGVSDLFAWRTEQLFKNHPKLGGLYYDVGGAGFCQNTEHGHGGIDAFGKPYFSSGAMALRELLMRIYKVHKKYDKTFFYHSHSYFNPVCHTFIDYFYPGEQFYRLIAENYEYAYCEGISLEEYQSEKNGKIKGVGMQFLPQYARSSRIKSISHLKKDFETNPEWAIRTITPMLLHDVGISASYIDKVTVSKLWKIQDDTNFKDAEFYGYWTEPGVKSSSSKVLISVYRWKRPAPYKVILVVSNMGRSEQPVALEMDWRKLDVSLDSELHELWLDKSLAKEDLQSFKLKGNHFMLIGVK